MGLFSQGGAGKAEHRRRRTDATSLSIIASDLEVDGDLRTKGVLKVEGRIRGTVRAGDQILVADGAMVEGDLETREAVVGGVIQGSIVASERVELLPSAVVTGNVSTARLLLHEGGTLNGEILMGTGQAAEPGPMPELPRFQRPDVEEPSAERLP